MGKGQASGSVKGLGAGFRYLECCRTQALGLLCVTFQGRVARVAGREASLHFGELLSIAAAGWRQSGTTVPGWGAGTPMPFIWTQTPDL